MSGTAGLVEFAVCAVVVLEVLLDSMVAEMTELSSSHQSSSYSISSLSVRGTGSVAGGANSVN